MGSHSREDEPERRISDAEEKILASSDFADYMAALDAREMALAEDPLFAQQQENRQRQLIMRSAKRSRNYTRMHFVKEYFLAKREGVLLVDGKALLTHKKQQGRHRL